MPTGLQQATLIAELACACSLSDQEVAHASGLTLSDINTLQSSPLFQAEVLALRKRFASAQLSEAQALLQLEALSSITTLVDIRDSLAVNPSIRLRAADSILDRVEATSKQHKVSHSVAEPLSFTDKQLEQLLAYISNDTRAREAFIAATQLLPEAVEISASEFHTVQPPLQTAAQQSNQLPTSDVALATTQVAVQQQDEADVSSAASAASAEGGGPRRSVGEDLRQFLQATPGGED